jgi:glycosyltransferase involved in cell wall biosynthesis
VEKKIKVLHLNASSSGGAFVVAQRLSEALNDFTAVHSEHLVYTGKPGNYHLWSSGFWKKKYAFYLHALEKLDFLRFEKNKSVRFAFSHGLTGINIENNKLLKEADIIHLHWINKGFVSLHGLDKILKLGKPVVWTCHDQWPFTGGCYYSGTCNNYKTGCGNCPMLKNPSENDLSAKVFQQKKQIFSDHNNLRFVCPSAWLANKGKESEIAKGHGIDVIPNGIDTTLFSPKNTAEIRQKMQIPDSKFVILFAAVNIQDKRKGFAEFIKLMADLGNKKPNLFHIIFTGDNQAEMPVNGNFTFQFTGFVSESQKMAEIYSAADLYVTTSNDDNLPTTIMESLACGTPVAAFAVGGIPEMIEEDKTGFLSSVYDTSQLADKIAVFANSEKTNQEKFRSNCRASALVKYEKSVIAKKYAELYVKMLESI